jgi:hypothetical protein
MSEIKSRGPMPAELQRQWEEDLAAIDRDEVEASFAKSAAAAAEDSFSGYVRRCVHAGDKPLTVLVDETQIDQQRFADFMHGEGLLDTAEVDRLLAALGVALPAAASVAQA